MHLNVCKYCNMIFYDSSEMTTCKNCKKMDDELFERIEAYLKNYPNSNAMQIAEGLEIKVVDVIRFVDEGRLMIVNGKWSRET